MPSKGDAYCFILGFVFRIVDFFFFFIFGIDLGFVVFVVVESPVLQVSVAAGAFFPGPKCPMLFSVLCYWFVDIFLFFFYVLFICFLELLENIPPWRSPPPWRASPHGGHPPLEGIISGIISGTLTLFVFSFVKLFVMF